MLMKKAALQIFAALAAVLFAASAWAQSESDAGDTGWTSEGVCNNVCFGISNNGLFSCSQQCIHPYDVKLPAGVDFLARKMRENLFPPVVKETATDVSQYPAGGPVNISILPDKDSISSIESLRIKFFYSFEKNGQWLGVAPEFDAAAGKWSASLSAPEGKSEFYYLTRISDEEDNSYIEIPCFTKTPAIGSEDCFFPLSQDEVFEPVESSKGQTGFSLDPALDLANSYIGLDDRRFYIRLRTVANIDPGSVIPAQYNYYMAGIFDPDRPAGEDPFHQTVFVLYAPSYFSGKLCALNRVEVRPDGLIENCINQSCALLMKKGQRWQFDTGSVFCEAKDNEILISLQRRALGELAAGTLAAYTASGQILTDDGSVISDFSPLTAVRFNNGSPIKLK